MENTKQYKETKVQTIQKQILDGRKVALLSSEKHTRLIRIRYNNTDTDGTKKWRIIFDNQEFHTSEIKISCPTRTLTETFEEVGEKNHIVCESTAVIFEDNIANIY